MSLRYSFAKARKTLSCATPYDIVSLEGLCRSIRIAEDKLQTAGSSAFLRCYNGCEGLCCRNLEIDSIIGFSDFIYLITVESQLQEIISTCIENENRIFAGNCVFLIDGKGPCLFPPTSRPEVCITSFCTDTESIKNEIRCVKSQFMKLNLYLLVLEFKILFRNICNKPKDLPENKKTGVFQ